MAVGGAVAVGGEDAVEARQGARQAGVARRRLADADADVLQQAAGALQRHLGRQIAQVLV